MKDQKMQVDVSVWAIIKVLLVLVAFYLLFLIRDILILFFLVLILVAAFNPVVNYWEKKIKRGPAVLVLFLIIFAVVAAVIWLIMPSLVRQISQLVIQLPELMDRFSNLKNYVPDFEQNLTAISNSLTGLTGGFVSITASVFGGVFTLLTALVLTAYLLLDKDAFANFIFSVFPPASKGQLVTIFDKIGQKLGNWLRGQAILGAIIALIDLIGLVIIGVPFALVLAIISGILEIVPTIGPIVAGLIAILVALAVDPIKAVFVAVLYVIVQQIENNFIVPKVMQKAVGLSPVIIILAVLVGAKLFGVFGAILAVPLAGVISVVIQDWSTLRKAFDKNDK